MDRKGQSDSEGGIEAWGGREGNRCGTRAINRVVVVVRDRGPHMLEGTSGAWGRRRRSKQKRGHSDSEGGIEAGRGEEERWAYVRKKLTAIVLEEVEDEVVGGALCCVCGCVGVGGERQ